MAQVNRRFEVDGHFLHVKRIRDFDLHEEKLVGAIGAKAKRMRDEGGGDGAAERVPSFGHQRC